MMIGLDTKCTAMVKLLLPTLPQETNRAASS